MRRWFRRKGKDTDQDGENGTAPLVEETEPGFEAAGEEALPSPSRRVRKRRRRKQRPPPGSSAAVFCAAGAGNRRRRTQPHRR